MEVEEEKIQVSSAALHSRLETRLVPLGPHPHNDHTLHGGSFPPSPPEGLELQHSLRMTGLLPGPANLKAMLE